MPHAAIFGSERRRYFERRVAGLRRGCFWRLGRIHFERWLVCVHGRLVEAGKYDPAIIHWPQRKSLRLADPRNAHTYAASIIHPGTAPVRPARAPHVRSAPTPTPT